jgi:hypothetical protein
MRHTYSETALGPQKWLLPSCKGLNGGPPEPVNMALLRKWFLQTEGR